jgi:hypothetical protein
VPQLAVHLLDSTLHAPLLLPLILKWNKQDGRLTVFVDKPNPKTTLHHAGVVHPRVYQRPPRRSPQVCRIQIAFAKPKADQFGDGFTIFGATIWE